MDFINRFISKQSYGSCHRHAQQMNSGFGGFGQAGGGGGFGVAGDNKPSLFGAWLLPPTMNHALAMLNLMSYSLISTALKFQVAAPAPERSRPPQASVSRQLSRAAEGSV